MSKPAANPFFETDFTKFFDSSRMADMSKAFGEFKMPAFNMEAIVTAHRKNIEAMTAANQLAFEGIQTIMRRQAELTRQNFEAATGLIQAIMSAPTPEEKMAKQAEGTKASLERNLASAKELTEMVAKNQCQALELVSNRVAETLDELQGMVKNNRAA